MTVADRILEEARGWLGTPYKKGRREKGVGVDCLNFMAGTLMEVGLLSDAPIRNYRLRFWEREDLIREGIEEGMRYMAPGYWARWLQEGESPRPGDILCGTQFVRQDRPNHCCWLEEIRPYGSIVLHARRGRDGRVERTRQQGRWRLLDVVRIEEVEP